MLGMRSGIKAPSKSKKSVRHNRRTAVAHGRSSVQTRPLSDKRPGKPRFMSSQRERFCQLVAYRGHAASSAYREAYDIDESKDGRWVGVEASRLINNPEIALRIKQLKQPIIDAGVVTLEGHLSKLAELRDDAHQLGEIPSAVTAEKARGQVAGFYIDRKVEAKVPLDQLIAGSYGKHSSGHAVKAVARKKKGAK